MKDRLWHWVYSVLSYIIPAVVLIVSIINPGINGYKRAMFPDMIYGTAHKPYVYRTLLPSMVRLIQAPIPTQFRSVINNFIYNVPFVQNTVDQLGWERNFLLDYVIALVLLYVFLYGFIGALKYLFDGMVYSPFAFSEAASLLITAGLPFLFKYYTYVYDFPMLFLFTLALGLMARQQWPLFMVVFIFATFNKETSILLTLIFMIHYFPQRLERKLFVKLLLIQLILFASIKILITYLYISNPGTFMEFHLYDYNMILFRKIKILPVMITWLPIIFLVFYKWNEKPKLLKNGLWILFPLIGLTSLFGFIDELRDYYEAYPIISLLIFFGFGKLVGIRLKTLPSNNIHEPMLTTMK